MKKRTANGWVIQLVWLAAAVAAGCGILGCGGHGARSRRSFDQIQRLVVGRTEAEVERLLGAPDSREPQLVDDEVWIWWDYTFLDGTQYQPELRGRVVHLEITFGKPRPVAGTVTPRAAWRVSGPFAVNYSMPQPARG
jgi:hypothetical protein